MEIEIKTREPVKQVAVRLPVRVVTQLEIEAKSANADISKVIRAIIEAYLKNK